MHKQEQIEKRAWALGVSTAEVEIAAEKAWDIYKHALKAAGYSRASASFNKVLWEDIALSIMEHQADAEMWIQFILSYYPAAQPSRLRGPTAARLYGEMLLKHGKKLYQVVMYEMSLLREILERTNENVVDILINDSRFGPTFKYCTLSKIGFPFEAQPFKADAHNFLRIKLHRVIYSTFFEDEVKALVGEDEHTY